MLLKCSTVLCVLWIGSWLAALLPTPAEATSVQVLAVDLNDSQGPGGDLWELTFQVSGRSFAADEGFAIEFDPSLFGLIVALPLQPSPDWDVLVLQPSTSLPAPGLYDALALIDGPSLAVGFVARVIWQGGAGTQPGSGLPFVVQAFAPDGSFLGVLEAGMTVPEPGMLALLSGSLLVALSRNRTHRRTR